MTLDLTDCVLAGPALPQPFVHFELQSELAKRGLLPAGTQSWDVLRQHLPTLGRSSGQLHVHNHVVAPLAHILGYTLARQDAVETREGAEDGGWLMQASDGTRLRSWTIGLDCDLDAPVRSGRSYRFSPQRCAQRVLRATGEPVGLLTNGEELRLLLCDRGRPDSHLAVHLDAWRAHRAMPDSCRLLLALAQPRGVAALPNILDAAQLSQARITKDLRVQARAAIEALLQAVLDAPGNAAQLASCDRRTLPNRLWQEALILVYRLLFILRMESAGDAARAFSFAATRLWRQALSPNQALAALVRRHLDQGHDTGRMLQDGLRCLFRAFRDGLSCNELCITPLGGALFGAAATPLLDALDWGERGVALLLDCLLWTTPRGRARERVHYGALDVEELGRVYEALLELEPGITDTSMVRLRRGRLETVVPARQAKHCAGAQTVVAEQIACGRFFLRAGSGRKATGAYYTPHAFVRFLVRETLAPQIRQCSPDDDPDPNAILRLKVVDPAVGSGHFLVEACRLLGDALYAACRQCDEQIAAAQAAAAGATAAQTADARAIAAARPTGAANPRRLQPIATLQARLASLPDPDGTLLAWLPSRAGTGGIAEARALAFCRRLVAVHCLYGVDRNALAVELAKLSLWLESYAEGLPLTFLDHRLLVGDSIAGPFFGDLADLPVSGTPLSGVVSFGIAERLREMAARALPQVAALEASVGRNAADLVAKQAAKAALDGALDPLRRLARAWSGAAMLGTPHADQAWLALARQVAQSGTWPARLDAQQSAIVDAGADSLPWDLAFPEVFAPDAGNTGGFAAVLGNPPWDVVQYSTGEFLAAFDLRVLDAPSRHDRKVIAAGLLADPVRSAGFAAYKAAFAGRKRLAARLFHHQTAVFGREPTAGNLDTFRLFAERKLQLARPAGAIGMLVPGAFHANEGATGLRQLYLQRTRLDYCLSFENRRRLFDIDGRFRFALIVARTPGPTVAMRCAFYLERLEQADDAARLLTYDPDFLRAAGGAFLAFPELRSQADLAVARQVFLGHATLGEWCAQRRIAFGRDLHMTDDAALFVPLERLRDQRGHLLLHEGKTFHQFTDRWETSPRYAIAAEALAAKPATQSAAGHYRLVFRDVARSSDERTLIASIAAPGAVFGHTATTERAPGRRPASSALLLCALLNSFVVDWAVRQKAATHLSLFIVQALSLPELSEVAERLLVHGALRLSCNHAGFAELWRVQLGLVWREPQNSRWPVLRQPADRWRVRAAMDAVLAQAFGLGRDQYRQVLAGFSHKSFPDAPRLCLDQFDALQRSGGTEYCRAADPYSEIPLQAGLPIPARVRTSAAPC